MNTPAGVSLYEIERDRVAKKRQAERITRAARSLLSGAGWDASPEILAETIRLEPYRSLYLKKDHAEIVKRAVELQAQPELRGTRLDPVTLQPIPYRVNTRARIADPDAIRQWLRELRRKSPKIRPFTAHRMVEEQFGVSMTYQNFSVTYWRKSAEPASKP